LNLNGREKKGGERNGGALLWSSSLLSWFLFREVGKKGKEV
jgi:hypothetical protein